MGFLSRTTSKGRKPSEIRYAVVGAGHIAQNAILPAFANARRNSRLTAIVSGDQDKRDALQRAFRVEHVLGYEEFDSACRADIFDAVFIALPNSIHCDFTCRAASAGIHVLCEKPMAVTVNECRRMIAAARTGGVKLMIAYRLHFEEANLKAVEIAQSGKLGDLRFFSSVFSMQVRPDNIRVDQDLGGGPLRDLGIYCINAARYLFRSQPTAVTALEMRGDGDPRFREIEEGISALMHFPGDRLAAFTCSFGAADASYYHLLGTTGDLRVDPAYEYEGKLGHRLTIQGKTRETTFRRRDQFSPEIIYFSDCILNDIEPEPSGADGLADVQIIEAIFQSIREQRLVTVPKLPADPSPALTQEIKRSPARHKTKVKVESAHAEPHETPSRRLAHADESRKNPDAVRTNAPRRTRARERSRKQRDR